MYGVRWAFDLLEWSLSKLYNVQPLGYIPESNIILYATVTEK